MASKFDVSSLTLNPKEVDGVSQFVVEKVFNDPILSSIHTVWQGVQMQEQIVFAGQLGLTGVKKTSCGITDDGQASALTQKYWNPVNVANNFVHCNDDLNGLFKAYYSKVTQYAELYDIQGSELATFLAVLIEDAVMKSVLRIAWNADLNVAASGASSAGLIDAVTNAKYFNHIDGIWAQIFDGVTAGDIEHTTTKVAALNALTTTTAQIVLADGDSVAVFEDMWEKADSRLRADATAQFLVSREIFENYRKYIQGKGENFSIDYTMDGLPTLKWNGKLVVNMETVWDRYLRTYFEQDSTNNAYWLPNRAILTTPANLPIGTLNQDDMSQLDTWYEKKDESLYTRTGYTLDAKLLEEYMIVAAY